MPHGEGNNKFFKPPEMQDMLVEATLRDSTLSMHGRSAYQSVTDYGPRMRRISITNVAPTQI